MHLANQLKRFFDISIATLGLIVISPLLCVIAAAIKLSDTGPILFFHERIGCGEKPFHMVKFRTMTQHAESLGPAITEAGDPRITPIGRFLRKTKMDELPQFWNVIKGEMSLVGPRPEVIQYTRLYDADQRQVLQLRPGITDPASLLYFDEERALAETDDIENQYVNHIMPAKLHCNLTYAKRASVRQDLEIILCTVARVLKIRWPMQVFLRHRPHLLFDETSKFGRRQTKIQPCRQRPEV